MNRLHMEKTLDFRQFLPLQYCKIPLIGKNLWMILQKKSSTN